MTRSRPSRVPIGLDIPDEHRNFLDDLDRKVPVCNYTATSDPAVTDDGEAGWQVGSRWVNTSTQQEFVCVNTTHNAAVWKQIT